MSLPKIDYPLQKITMPSTKKQLTVRPFLVKEEKILLMGQQGGEEKDLILALKQIVTNCVQDKNFNADDLTSFDLEYMFIKLRAISVDNIAKLSYRDLEDDKVYNFEVNLDKVDLVYPEKNNDGKIKINKDMGMILNYPSVATLSSIPEELTDDQQAGWVLLKCIEKIYDADKVYVLEEESPEELEAFVDSLNVKVYDEIRKFYQNMPRMEYTISYKNSLDSERTIVLSRLKDFFMWG